MTKRWRLGNPAGPCVDARVIDLHGTSLEALERTLADGGFKPSHGARILRRFQETGGTDWDSPALPNELRSQLGNSTAPAPFAVAARQESADGTTKLLLRLADARTIESVLMPDHRADRAAGCISSQVGCAMGCDFCATAQNGFERNLTVGEIVGQFLALCREATAQGRALRTIVFMGMGEPMLNLDNVIAAVDRIA